MKILIVCNNAYMRGNGVCSAVTSLRDKLLNNGIEVRLLACENPEKNGMQPDYHLKHFVFPIFEPIVAANGYRYPQIDKKIISEAVEWADLIHLMEGFPLQATTVKIAKKMNKPCVGTYHILTENITTNLGFTRSTFINRLINLWWSKSVYNHCAWVQCPSQTVKKHLEENKYTAPLKVISNGITLDNRTALPCNDPQDKSYLILCIGRLSNEKSQKTLLEAMRYSSHAHEIQLHFVGNGQKAKKLIKMAHRLVKDDVLKHEPVFGFYSSEELKMLARKSYLYIHCATIEVEGLSCLEAIQQGTVPVIAKGGLTATHQFALDDRSIFPVKDSKKLAERIDWWIEHPLEREQMSKLYAESAIEYDINISIEKIINMYKEVLNNELA